MNFIYSVYLKVKETGMGVLYEIPPPVLSIVPILLSDWKGGAQPF